MSRQARQVMFAARWPARERASWLCTAVQMATLMVGRALPRSADTQCPQQSTIRYRLR